AIARQLNRFGYTPHPKQAARSEMGRREERQALIRIGVAGAIAGNTMVIAFALYGGLFHGMDLGTWTLFRWASLGFALLAPVWPGRVFLRSAWAALRTRTAHIDLPIAVGLLAGVISGAVNTVRGSGDVYFDSVTVLIFLLLIGRWLQMRQQRKSQDAIAMLFALTPATARRCENDDTRIVPVEALRAGDLVDVRPGECIPADGTITSGATTVNRALLSGESQPIEVGRGDDVCAGVTNCSQRIIMRISATGRETRIGRLMDLVERTANERAPVVETTHRIAGIFVCCILALAAITAVIWLPHDPSKALACAMALLIVTCPCALGLATPLAIVSSIGRAARRGILIKGGAALQTLHRPGTILFDKTGTLTMGTLSVIDWRGPEDLKPLIARAERDSSHPAGVALRTAFGVADDDSAESAA
ncbi:MAG: HAD-IC family P-type ATPase, partial [Phycisphaerales bacterium]|nr:HAD-IC family P-type ATPase [Phycisphaerales bacterium]